MEGGRGETQEKGKTKKKIMRNQKRKHELGNKTGNTGQKNKENKADVAPPAALRLFRSLPPSDTSSLHYEAKHTLLNYKSSSSTMQGKI